MRLRDYYLYGAMTDNGHNDTSVPIGAAGGQPGGGEIPMMMARNRQSVACPRFISHSGVLRTNRI